MKKRIIVGIASAVIIFLGVFISMNVSTEVEQSVETQEGNKIEIQPEEEIPEESNYDTKIKLYFSDATSGILRSEERIVDARKLIDNPYIYVLDLLIEGPESEELKSEIPEGTKINSAIFNKGTLKIDLSEEFLNSNGTNPIYSIVNTMYEFNEIDNIKFTINGEEKNGLKENFIKKD